MCCRRSAVLNPRLSVGVLLQSVLCAAWLVPLVTGSTTLRNGSASGKQLVATVGERSGGYRAGRDARFVASFGVGSERLGQGFDSVHFSLYPTEWSSASHTGNERPPSRGSELVRLYEGGGPDDEFEPVEEPYAFTSQPVLHDQQNNSDREELQLSRAQLAESDLFSDVTVAPNTAGVGDERTSHRLSLPNQSKDDLIVMAATPALTRVSEFVRGMLQRFGVTQFFEAYQARDSGAGGLTANVQRLLPHRFLPHFVNTSKGLRNIPHQLNDGQLQLAPEDAASGSQSSGAESGNPAAAGTEGGSKTPGNSPGSTGTIGSLFNNFKRKLKAIYPGTVWCGDGNQAKSEDDIGFFYLTDSCCRAHDLCPITIAAGEQFNRLKNNGHFTRSHCDCDKQFFNCLKNANTLVSRQIGYTYFNLLKPQCFRHEHPKVNCTKRSRGKCLSYVVDEKQTKRWQWFDNLIF